MVTNYLYLNREMLDEVKGTLGSVLVVTRRRTDAVNFYNELLYEYKNAPGSVMYDSIEMTVSSKPNKITVKAVEQPSDLAHLRDQIFTKVFAVGCYVDDELEMLNQLMNYRKGKL